MKKVLSIILCTLMLVVCVPVMPAYAEESNVFIVSNGVEFVDQWSSAGKVSGIVKLERDVNIANEYNLDSNRCLTIDLNGHTIKGVGDSSDYIFNITDGGSLTIKDSSEAQNGRIIVTRVYEDYEEVIIVNEGGRLTLESGTLQGNEDDDCRIVDVESGTFIMNGGIVTGNTYNGDGAGIYINEGSFTMNDGIISNNHGDMSNDYGGGVFFDGSTSSRLYIRGGEFFGNSAYDGGAIYIDDGYVEITGSYIHNNFAILSSAIMVSGTADSVLLSGDLFVTENGKDLSSGTNSLRSAVFVSYPALTTLYVYLGGRIRIFGNYPRDFYAMSGKNEIHIMEDMDTTPENHAWIGIAAASGSDVIDYSFVGETSKEYSVCFFGNQENGIYSEPLVYSLSGAPYVMGTSSQTGTIDAVQLHESGIKGSDGAALNKNTDYTISYDSVMREYSIRSKKPVTLDNAGSLFTNKNSSCNGSINLVKTSTEEDVDGTTYTYYYLCEYNLYLEPYLFSDSSYNIIKKSYYTVKVFVEDLKFFKNCNVDNQFISGLMPATTSEQFIENCVAVENLETSFTMAGNLIGTNTKITANYNGYSYEFTAVIFGDVNGDGWYDGTDSIIVNCLANGLLSREQVGEAVYMAADCNHDGVIDSLDVTLLEQAGMILASVDQSKSAEELQTDSAYQEYINLIDQTVETENVEENTTGETDTTTETPVDEQFNQTLLQRIFAFIKYIFKLIASLF